jgi:hypothetical protein
VFIQRKGLSKTKWFAFAEGSEPIAINYRQIKAQNVLRFLSFAFAKSSKLTQV